MKILSFHSVISLCMLNWYPQQRANDIFASAVPVISLTKQWMGSCLGLTGNQPMIEEALSFQSFTTYLD